MGDDDSDQHDALRGADVRRSNILDDVASGMTPASSRPGWRLLLEELSRGDVVIVASLRTLGEDSTDVALTLGALEHMGVTVRAIQDDIDTSKQPGPTLEALSRLLQPCLTAQNPTAA